MLPCQERPKRMSEEGKRFLGHSTTGVAILLVVIFAHKGNIFDECATAGYFLILVDSFIVRRSQSERTANFRVAALLVLIPLLVLPLADGFEGSVRPLTLDREFRCIDLRLGLDGFALSRLCLAHLWTVTAVRIIYSGLPLAFALGWIATRSYQMVRAAVTGALLAMPCYLLAPACGPEYAWENWPHRDAVLLPTHGASLARNCMPSMHFTWAMLLALNARGHWRIVFSTYAALMALATVAGGEHYSIDVIAAVPFTLAVQAIAVHLPAWQKVLKEVGPAAARPACWTDLRLALTVGTSRARQVRLGLPNRDGKRAPQRQEGRSSGKT
jgi:hypothetical protein